MALNTRDLIGNSVFESLSNEEQNQVVQDLAQEHPEDQRNDFLTNAGSYLQQRSRDLGFGRVNNKPKVYEAIRGVLPTDFDDLDDDEKVDAIDNSRDKIRAEISKFDPVTSEDTLYFAEQEMSGMIRNILGQDVSWAGDKAKRFAGGVVSSFVAPFSETAANEFNAMNLPTNPNMDKAWTGKLATGLGDFAGQIGQYFAIAALTPSTGGASLGLLGAKATLTGSRVAMGVGLAQNASRKFQENYNIAKGEAGLSDDEALQAGIAGMPGALIDSFGDALLLKGIKLGSVSKSFKAMTAAEKAAEITTKAGAMLKEPKFMSSLLSTAVKGGLTEGVSEMLGDAATGWGGYATSGHEGFIPKKEDLWDSFWIGGLLGGGFSSLSSGKNYRNEVSLQKLGGTVNADEIADMTEAAQGELAGYLDNEDYTGAANLINKFKAEKAKAMQIATPEASQEADAVAPEQPIATSEPVVNIEPEKAIQQEAPAIKQEFLDAIQNEPRFLQLMNMPKMPANVIRQLPTEIQSAAEAVHSVMPAAKALVRSRMDKNGAAMSIEQVNKSVDDEIEAVKASTKPPAPKPTKESVRAKFEPKKPAEVAKAPEQDKTAPDPQNAPVSQPDANAEVISEPVKAEVAPEPEVVNIEPEEAAIILEDLGDITKQEEDIAKAIAIMERTKPAKKAAKKKASKKDKGATTQQAEEPVIEESKEFDLASEIQSTKEKATQRINNMLMLSKYRKAILVENSDRHDAVEQNAAVLNSDLEKADTLIAVLDVMDKLDTYNTDQSVANPAIIEKMQAKLGEIAKSPSRQDVAQRISDEISNTGYSDLLFQGKGGDIKAAKLKPDQGLHVLAAAKTYLSALKQLGLESQADNADVDLAMQMNYELSTGSYSIELLEQLDAVVPQRTIFTNKVNSLRNITNDEKNRIIQQVDALAVNSLKAGRSLQSFYATLPDIKVISKDGNKNVKGYLSMDREKLDYVNDARTASRLVETKERNLDEAAWKTTVNIPFAATPNTIILVKGNYDVTTVIHELDHNLIVTGVAQEIVESTEGGKEAWDTMLAEIGAERGKPWSAGSHEAFVNAREAWLANGGSLPADNLFQKVFKALQDIFQRMYSASVLAKWKNPEIEKALVRIYGLTPMNELELRNKFTKQIGQEAGELSSVIESEKLTTAQAIIDAAKSDDPEVTAKKIEKAATRHNAKGGQSFTEDQVAAIKRVAQGMPIDLNDQLMVAMRDRIIANSNPPAQAFANDQLNTSNTGNTEYLELITNQTLTEPINDSKQSENGNTYSIIPFVSSVQKPEMSEEMKQAIVQKIRGIDQNQKFIEPPINVLQESTQQEPVVLLDEAAGVTVIDSFESNGADEQGNKITVKANDTIANQANSNLSAASKKAYAAFIGAAKWTADTASKFAKDFADYMAGAKFPSVISELFSQFMVSLKASAIAGLSFFSMQSFVGQELNLSAPVTTQTEQTTIKQFSVVNPQKIQDQSYIQSLIEIYSTPQAPSYDADDEQSSIHQEPKNDAAIILDYIQSTNDNGGKPYIIVSKREGVIRLYDANGKLKHKSTVLLGKSEGDVVTDRNRSMAKTRANDKLKITPSGRYETKTTKSKNYGEVVGLESYDNGTRNAIHRVCTKFAHQKRLERLAGKLSNRISLGCINVYDSTALKVNELMRDGGVVYVTPDTKSMDEYVQDISNSETKTTSKLYQYAGEKAVRSQFLTDSLDAAKAMAAAGKSQEEIRAITVWFPSPYDGKMRWEIPDNEAKLLIPLTYGKIKAMQPDVASPTFYLSEVINHKKLQKAYPQFFGKEYGKISVSFTDAIESGSASFDGYGQIEIGYPSPFQTQAENKNMILNALLHELQHAIQSVEGFAVGSSIEQQRAISGYDAYMEETYQAGLLVKKIWGQLPKKTRNAIQKANQEEIGSEPLTLDGWLNFDLSGNVIQRWLTTVESFPDLSEQGLMTDEQAESLGVAIIDLAQAHNIAFLETPYNRYLRSAGEIEARDVEARSKLTPKQRAAIAPYSSENIAPEDAIVMFNNTTNKLYQRAASSSEYTTDDIHQVVALADALKRHAYRMSAKMTPEQQKLINKVEKSSNVLRNSINKTAGKTKSISKAQQEKAVNFIADTYQEYFEAASELDQQLMGRQAMEFYEHMSVSSLSNDSFNQANNIPNSKENTPDQNDRVAMQKRIKTLLGILEDAKKSGKLLNGFLSHVSPEFRKLADKLMTLTSRGTANIMSAFNSQNQDLLERFTDNIQLYYSYQSEGMKAPADFSNVFDKIIDEVSIAYDEFKATEFLEYNFAMFSPDGVNDDADKIGMEAITSKDGETAREYLERMQDSLRKIEAILAGVEAESEADKIASDEKKQKASEERAAKINAKRVKVAELLKQGVRAKFATVTDFIADRERQYNAPFSDKVRAIYEMAYNYVIETDVNSLDADKLREFSPIAMTLNVRGNHSNLMLPYFNYRRQQMMTGWLDTVSAMAGRGTELIRNAFRSQDSTGLIGRLMNDFDKKFQANVENFSVWADRFSKYPLVRKFMHQQFFGEFEASAFIDAENSSKNNREIIHDLIKEYNESGIDTTQNANPYMWVTSILSQYNVNSDPNKGFEQAVGKVRNSIRKAKKKGGRLQIEAQRNEVALQNILAGINLKADNAFDQYTAVAYDRLGEGNPELSKARAELINKFQKHFAMGIADQIFIREVIHSETFTTVHNYIPLKTENVDGGQEDFDLLNVAPEITHNQSPKNVNAKSQSSRVAVLPDNRMYNMDLFYMIERKTIKNAVDAESIISLAVLNTMLGKKIVKDEDGMTNTIPREYVTQQIFGVGENSGKQLDIIREKIAHQMIQIYGVTEPPNSFVSAVRKSAAAIQTMMLSGIGQFVQQSTSAIVDYSIRETGNLGYMLDAAKYYFNNYQKIRSWMEKHNRDLYERGNTQGILDYEKAVNNAGQQIAPYLDAFKENADRFRKLVTISLRYGDKLGSELIFLAEHRKALEANGLLPKGAEYDIDDYTNSQITAVAMDGLNRFVGTSGAAGRSYWMSDHKQTYGVLRAVTGSFQSSAHNMSSQLLSSARNYVALLKDKNPESKKEANEELRRMAAIFAQQMTFTTARHAFTGMLTLAAANAIGAAFDDEDDKIEDLTLALDKARAGKYSSDAQKIRAIAEAERKLADAKVIRKAVINMKQSASGDSLFKSAIRDQVANLHILNSVGDSFAPKLVLMVANVASQANASDVNEQLINKLKKQKSEAIADGDRKRAAKIAERIVNLQSIEYIPYFYEKKDKSGFGGIIGGVLDPVYSSIKESTEDLARKDKDFLSSRAFFPDMLTYMAALGLGQADVNRVAKQLQRIDDDLSRNREESKKRIDKNIQEATNKP